MDATQLVKGVLDIAVLAVVEQEDDIGYDIVRRLRAATWRSATAGALGASSSFVRGGWVACIVVPSEEGPHRKYYGINAQGRATLDVQRKVRPSSRPP